MAARGSEIVHHAWGGTTFAGLDAVNLFRAVCGCGLDCLE